MGTSKQTIVISAEVQASLTGMEQVVSKLQKGIKEGTTKLDLNKGLGASLSKNIAAFEKDYERIQKLTEGGVISLGDTKEFTKKGQHLISIFEDIQRVVGNFDNLEVLDAKKLFPQAFDNRVKDLKEVLNGLQTSFDKLASKGLSKDALEKDIAGLEKEIGELKEKASKESELKISSDKAQANLQEAKKAIDDIKQGLKDSLNLQIATSSADIEKAKKDIANIQKKRKGRQSTKEIVDDGTHVVKYKGKSLAQWKKAPKTQQSTAAIKVLENYAQESAELEKLQDLIDKTTKKVNDLNSAYAKVETGDLSKIAASIGQGTEEVDKITAALKNQEQASEDATDAAKKLGEAQAAAAKIATKEGQLNDKKNKLAATIKEIESLTQKVDFSRLQKAFKELDIDITPEMLKNQDEVEHLQQELNKIDQAKLQNLKNALNQLGLNTDEVRALMKKLGVEIENVGDTSRELNRAEQDMARLQDQILDFFSISNTIQIFKDAVRDAFDTVKELDAAMTETAVVTDFSIGDMWDKLPEYSEEANKLGTSIKSLYEATTLYYQQGLQSNEAMGVGVETMKMARIANMDAAAATEAMTAALRGFNMEINETSATRVNDVYSELAAITAADTSQIATAMSKTASIASSANMEFETTAALLAQIIETTQEAPETAGTAMKTIIARFTEVKQLFDEGMLTGEDAEGEAIDINKIDAALEKVGISLKDFLTGQKGIDDIFLELASKWDSLDLATQRYIATTAAGSRQQSRFLAMMSNYDRTMELVTAANNSAGASQEQFNKTLDSLDAKLQRLKNAWDTFTMGLANNEVIKGAVDILTMLLEGVNNLTGVAGNDGLGGVVTMFIRLGTVIGALKGGEGIIKGLIKSIAAFSSSKAIKQTADSLTSGMGLGQALFTKWAQSKGIIGLTDNAAEDTKVLGNITTGFSKAKTGAVVFAKSLAALGPYIAILIAIGAAVYGIAKSFKAAQKETKLNALNESIKELDTEAQNAQEQLREIGSARTELNGLQTTLDGLTRGTAEWKSALIDVNQQVLNLIDKYPSLSEYVTYGASGEMQIDEAGWDNLLKHQQQVISNMNAQRIAMQSQAQEITKSIDFQEFVVQTAGIKPAEEKLNIQAIAATADATMYDSPAALFGAEVGSQIARLFGASDQVATTSPNMSAHNTQNSFVIEEKDEYTEAEKRNVERRIASANWADENTTAMAMMAATADATMYDSPAALFGAEVGSQIARLFGASDQVATTSPNMSAHNRTMAEGGYTKQLYKDLTGFTEEQYYALAEYFADNTLKVDESERETQVLAAFEKLGIDNIDGALERFMAVLADADNQFYDLVEAVQDNTAAEQRLTHQFVNNAIMGSNIADKEYSDAIGNIIAKGQDQTLNEQVDAMVEIVRTQYGGEELDEVAIAKKYAEIMGYQAAGGEVYTDGTYSKKVETGIEGMLRAIATFEVTDKIQTKAEDVSTYLEEKDQFQKELFDSLFSVEGKDISAAQINKYKKDDGTIDLPSIQKDLDMTFEQLSEKLNEIGIDSTDIEKTLTDNLILATERIAKQRADLTKRMTKYSSESGKDYQQNATDLAILEEKFGEWFRDTLDGTLNSLERTGDSKLVSEGLEYFRNVALVGAEQDVQELSKLISDIDWTNPIEAAHRLNREIENGSKLAQGFALTISQSDSQFLSAESQFNSLYTSDQYEDLQKDLKEIYETQGKITDADIRGLASEYSYLNKMMKNTSATGAGLADILTAIEKGELSFDAVTDAVIAAVGQMDSLGQATDEVLQKLKELDLGDDLGEVQDKYTEFGDKTKEWQEKGQYGNEQYENLLNYAFGKDWDVGFEDDLTGRMDQLSVIMQKLGEDMSYAWVNASKGLDIYGNKISSEGIQKLTELGIQLENVNGEVVFDIPDDMDFDTITQLLSETFGASKELWDDLMVYFESRDPNFRRSWITADYKTMGQRIVESETTEVGGKKVITQKEIEDIANIQAGKTSKTTDEIISDIEKQLKDYEGEITIIPKLEGLDASEVITKLDEVFGGFANNFKVALEGGVTGLDLYGMMNSLLDLGLSSEIASQIVNGAAAGAADANQSLVAMVDGQTIEIPMEPADGDFVAAMTAEIEKAKAAAKETPIEQTAEITVDQAKWQSSINTARSYMIRNLSGHSVPITAYVSKVIGPSGVNVTGTTSNTTTSPSNTTSNGKYNRTVAYDPSKPVLLMAEGTENHPKDDLALTGEEGPELVETKNGAYLVGTEGPQMANIKRGDTVHTAEETKEIYKRKGISVPAFKGGSLKPVSALKGSSGGKSSDDDEETWENPFDKLYNLVRKIDEELRERERIERRYEKLLEGLNASANKIINISREELAHLEKERMLQEQLVAGRKYQIDEYQKENSDLQKYARVMENDRGESILRIDWDLIDTVTDTDQGERIEEYVSQLEEWFDSLEEAEDALWDIEDAVAEIKERGEDEYFELEEVIKDALTQSYQDQIDKLNEINTSINDTNSSLLDAIQTSIDKQRQDRDNQRTEDELAEKQRRLLYLQQDTSGANALEILKLQDEIAQGQEDYTDTLIDQKISELQEQNDKAAEQREKQITILQAQLDHYLETGEIWKEVYGLMEEGLDWDKGLVRGSRLEEILKNAENFSGLSAIGQQSWWVDMNNMIAQALAYLELGRQLEDIGVKNQEIEMVLPDGSTVKGTVDDQGNVTTSDGKTYNNVWQGADGRYYASENIQEPEEPVVEHPNDDNGGGSSEPETPTYPNWTDDNIKGISEVIAYSASASGWGKGQTRWNKIDTKIGPGASQVIQSRVNDLIYKKIPWTGGSKPRREYYYDRFLHGGLADFTGPAWLDGTKARPEIVLDAQDSRNFVQLRDILSAVLNRGNVNTSTENNGDITYDIDINVESIGSDYDVEQVANKVKSLINEDARYRNNNAVSLKR